MVSGLAHRAITAVGKLSFACALLAAPSRSWDPRWPAGLPLVRLWGPCPFGQQRLSLWLPCSPRGHRADRAKLVVIV